MRDKVLTMMSNTSTDLVNVIERRCMSYFEAPCDTLVYPPPTPPSLPPPGSYPPFVQANSGSCNRGEDPRVQIFINLFICSAVVNAIFFIETTRLRKRLAPHIKKRIVDPAERFAPVTVGAIKKTHDVVEHTLEKTTSVAVKHIKADVKLVAGAVKSGYRLVRGEKKKQKHDSLQESSTIGVSVVPCAESTTHYAADHSEMPPPMPGSLDEDWDLKGSGIDIVESSTHAHWRM
jgi:hypothetical protein